MIISLSPHLEDLFANLYQRETPTALAADVLKLSDFYNGHHGARSPWNESYAVRAYAAYFMPLNVARLMAAWQEVRRFLKPSDIHEVWDFGSGLGSLHWVLEDQDWLNPHPFYCLERDHRAMEHHRTLASHLNGQWRPEFNPRHRPGRNALGVFSYSFLEMQESLPPLEDFAHLLIVEPSFKDTSRALMKWRDRWIQAGFTPLAPCTHSLSCPLLEHSPRDWCHQRIHFSQSGRFKQLESHLPMKNHTLTYSYLLLSQGISSPAFRGAARVIGDTLREKGKTKQMVCRGPEREFLSWLSRDGEAPIIPHGALITDLGSPEIRGNELRVKGDLSWVD